MIRVQPEKTNRIGRAGHNDLIPGFQGPAVHAVDLEFCCLIPFFLQAETDF